MKRTRCIEPADPQVEEFLRRDLGKDIRRGGGSRLIRSEWRQMPTSILLSPILVSELRKKAARRGIGYQTLLKIILHEHLEEY